jgi:hypothetical protein
VATIVFGDGHRLKVAEGASTVVQRISDADQGNSVPVPFEDGSTVATYAQFLVTTEAGKTLSIRPGPVAYVLP